MPEIEEIVHSDEEYHDSVSDEQKDTPKAAACSIESNKAIVDEIINMNNLNLNDEKQSDGEASGGNTSVPLAEYAHEEIDEEALKDKEASMTLEELKANKETAHNMKLKANEMFKNNESEQAIDVYTEALSICPLQYKNERAVLYGNRAAAKIKIGLMQSALSDCSKAIELWPEYVRALVRRAKLYEHQDKLDEALADYKRVYELDPGQNDAREALIRLPPLIDERNERLKEEMMGKLKDLGNMILKPFGLSTSNFQMQKDPNTGSYSINFNQNPS